MMDKKEIALQITLKAMEQSKLPFAAITHPTGDVEEIQGSCRTNANLAAEFYNSVFEKINLG